MITWPAGAANAVTGRTRAGTSVTMIRQKRIERLLTRGRWMPCRTAPTLGSARERVKVGERVRARPHPSEVLRLAHPREQRADRRPGREPQAVHHVLTAEERWRRAHDLLLREAGQEVAQEAGAAPDAERRGAGHRGGVDERQEQEVLRVLREVAVEAVARAAGHPAGGLEVHRAEVVAHEALQQPRRAGRAG